MSTIASPRPSIALSSRRNSVSTDGGNGGGGRSSSTSRVAPANTHTRRNRAALRDYYGLKSAAQDAENKAAAAQDGPEDNGDTVTSELDKPDFNADAYIAQLLTREGIEGILRAEARLVSEIRGYDGERKALVYDNYSKLIGATDTIRRMRTNMDPLTPATSTLTPAIAHIAATAAGLSESLRKLAPNMGAGGVGPEDAERERERERQRVTVRWVLGAPTRLRGLCEGGRGEEARSEWGEVRGLLEKWGAVKGVEQVRKECEEVMKGYEHET